MIRATRLATRRSAPMATTVDPSRSSSSTSTEQQQDAALLALLRHLQAMDYRFVTPTPATHARVVARPERRVARSLADVLGWSLSFERGTIDPAIFQWLDDAAMLVRDDDSGLWKSRVRVSSLRERLFLHSAYPTEAEDAVFFGPDSYRFGNLIAAEFDAAPCPPHARLVDIGAGAGVGAIIAAGLCPEADIVMTDINPKALRFARINAAAAGVRVDMVQGEGLAGVENGIDIAFANPPYIVDDGGRAYRDGGGMHGGEVAVEMTSAAVARLAPRGRFILYTGSAIIDGDDRLRTTLANMVRAMDCTLRYHEIDPDVFGEELDGKAYRHVDRIAVVAAVITRR